MRRFPAAAMTIGIVCLVVACGGDGGPDCSANPAAPGCPPPPPPVVTFTSSAEHLKVHDTYTFSATAAHSDRTSAQVTQWSSDNTSVATVDPTSGKVTAVAQGLATIIAEHDGARATKLLHVVPLFHGAWQGTYVVTACTDAGDFRTEGFCVDLGVGQTLPIALGLSQTLDSADGLMALGEAMADVKGRIDDGGVLSLDDTRIDVEGGTVKVTTIRLTVDGDERLQGSFRTDWTFPGAAGYGQFDARLASVTRVSAAVAPASSRPSAAGSWRELVRRLKKR